MTILCFFKQFKKKFPEVGYISRITCNGVLYSSLIKSDPVDPSEPVIYCELIASSVRKSSQFQPSNTCCKVTAKTLLSKLNGHLN